FNDSRFNLTAGLRGGYWNINKEFYAGPRAVFSFKPIWQKNMVFRASAGYYYQPPFYKELRDLQGNVNRNVKAQTSIHFVAGGDYVFTAWNRPFKYTVEAYYKILNNLIP